MAHKGLSPDAVVKAAVELIEQQGRDAFSMRLLADQLGIKTASLYNHVENMAKRPCGFWQKRTAVLRRSTGNFTG